MYCYCLFKKEMHYDGIICNSLAEKNFKLDFELWKKWFSERKNNFRKKLFHYCN